MISLQGFIQPQSKIIATNREIPASAELFPGFPKFEVRWTRLLGESNNELVLAQLTRSPKVNTAIQTIREDFIQNHTNLRKFPKMNEGDWE